MTDGKPTGVRLYFVDNLRILLITLVILWHLAITYGASGFWPYREREPDDLTALVFTLFSAVNGPYVLGFFFLIAGYFSPRSYDRKGFWPFLKDRLLRLGIPLLIYVLVFDPAIHYAIGVQVYGFAGSFWQYLGRHFRGYEGLGVGPLWFAEALLIFTILYGLWRLLASGRPSSIVADNQPRSDGEPAGNADKLYLAPTAVFALLLGVVTFIVRIWLPVGYLFAPLGLPLGLFPQYVALFVAGTIAYRRNWFLAIPNAMAKWWFVIALTFIVVLFPLVFVLGGALEGNTAPFMGGRHWQSFAYSVWEQFVCVGMVIALLVWFRNRFDRQDKLARAMSASTYAVYFIHAPVLVFLALALRGITLHPLLKFSLVAPVAVALCFLLAHTIRKLPLARNIL